VNRGTAGRNAWQNVAREEGKGKKESVTAPPRAVPSLSKKKRHCMAPEKIRRVDIGKKRTGQKKEITRETPFTNISRKRDKR